jgi:hypothetical protein
LSSTRSCHRFILFVNKIRLPISDNPIYSALNCMSGIAKVYTP